MDKIHIRDLAVDCIIGTRPEERKARQKVVLGITLSVDLAVAGRTDNIDETVNYSKLRDDVVSLVESSQFFLLERLADRVAELCLLNRRTHAVQVTLDKPAALEGARSVAVEITREKRGTR